MSRGTLQVMLRRPEAREKAHVVMAGVVVRASGNDIEGEMRDHVPGCANILQNTVAARGVE